MHSSRCRSRSVGGAQGAGCPARGWQPATRRRSARDRSRSPRSWAACPVLVWAVCACSMGTVARLAPLTTCLYEPPAEKDSAASAQRRCTGWWGSGPRLAACIPAKVLLREAASLLAGYIRARISRHAYHSTHILARILRHTCQSTHVTARVTRHVGSCLLAGSLQARACGLVFADSLRARVCRLPVLIQ